MRKFIQKAFNKFDKLNKEQIKSLFYSLASENELLEIVLSSMTDGVMVTDSDHRILFLNKSAERVFPLIKGDVLEKIIWEVIYDSEVSSFLKKSLKNQEKVVDKEINLEIGGSVRVLSSTIMPLVKEGLIQGNLFHIEDVTEKKNKEARLRRAESLASLTTLTAGVAHEIKNPLGSIGIHIQLIQKSLKKTNDIPVDTINNYLDIVNEEVQRLNGIVVDFLFAVRPMDTHLEKHNLNNIITDLLEFVHFEIDESHVKIINELCDNIPLLLLDEKYLKQAILNIIKNALNAMPEGGELKIKTEEVGNNVVLTFADNGIGIPEENIAKIFEPYFTTKEFGSGLGLTLVYKIIKEHNGEITINSKENEGTSFIISFPVTQEKHKLLSWKDLNYEV